MWQEHIEPNRFGLDGAVRPVRRTKILVTLGPATDSRARLEDLVRAGVNGFRLNFSHATDAEHRRVLRDIHRVRRLTGREVAIVADLQGPKIRLGDLVAPTYRLAEGATWILEPSTLPGDDRRAPVVFPDLVAATRVGDPLLVGDGAVELEVVARSSRSVTTRVVHGGVVSAHQGLYLPRARLRPEILGPKDLRDLSLALEEGIDYVALSFVRNGSDVREVRRRIGHRNRDGRVGVIAKIERAQALEAIDGILEESEGIMVARGDLGIEVPLERLALVQKSLIRRANARGRLVIVATQLLLSMVGSPRPTRAEATDVANAVLDGTDALMLSEESAVGLFPLEAVSWLDKIARATESSLLPRGTSPEDGPVIPGQVGRAVARAAVDVAKAIGAVAIVTPTHSGQTARTVAQLRPTCPIVALSSEAETRRSLSLVWGVESGRVPPHLSLVGLRESAVATARGLLGAAPGAKLVVTAGYPIEGIATNLVNVLELPPSPPPASRRRRGGRGRRLGSA